MRLSACLKSHKCIVAIRIALGIVFLFSSSGKIIDPSAFAGILHNYQLLSQALIVPLAVVFPWIELFCGLALIAGRFEKGAALLVCLMMVVFIGVIGYNGYRGLNIACGCFSLSAREPSNIAVNILRNLALLAAAMMVLVDTKRRRTGPPV
ncbi:DoxX family protein [Desulfosarcina cetonica]|uniref:MauE/DoxX family redox-associated membrane protein n=1 Tax=Desulfosarcina cetonica TaxID=90730 RepID=UPI0006D29F4D|nr:MauE/DoxX family redox-associated membrane protein [Desulfosarcina cetonica]VTR66432.1 DoxX family protein [Desulfosarcina cetonica]